MSGGSSWLLAKSSEQVCQERDGECKYKSMFVWETIYMDNFWQVQRRHDLAVMSHDSFAPSFDSALNNLHIDRPDHELCNCGCSGCIFCCELPFRILSTCASSDIVVAMASSSKSILQKYLHYLTQNVSPMLECLQIESHKQSNTEDSHAALSNFVILKVCALIERQNQKRNPQAVQPGTKNHLQLYFPAIEDSDIKYSKFLCTRSSF